MITINHAIGTRHGRAAIDRLQRQLDYFVGRLGHLAAMAAVDIWGVGRFHLVAGYADRQRTIPAESDHLYQIGNQTKSMVAVALLLLHRQGSIDLDAPVVASLDLPIDQRITTRHLITNSSGLGEYTHALLPARFDPRLVLSPQDLVSLALPQGQLFQPGLRFDYCNTGWVIAAMLIDRICGKDYGEVIQQLILEPLGLTNSSISMTPPTERMLRAYVSSIATTDFEDASDGLSWAYGAGQGVSCLDDMLDYFGSFCRESPLEVSLADLTSSMLTHGPTPNVPLTVGADYGLGIESRAFAGNPVFGHPGSTRTYLSSTWLDPEQGVAVATIVTRALRLPATSDTDARYPREQLFSTALSAAYALTP